MTILLATLLLTSILDTILLLGTVITFFLFIYVFLGWCAALSFVIFKVTKILVSSNDVKSILKQLKKSQLRLKALDVFGSDFKKSNHVISITPDKGVRYSSYIKLKDMIAKSYRELRSELAKKRLGRTWKDLSLEEKKMLEMVYKKNVSESPIEKK